ncbi:MAG TPA: alpha/beta hydrolase [Ferruginibacter sp.]|nr:alpha/beta hydrolase [Ferruginibacter sp.]HRE63305.1 alpha/beta hydrolase [Ferruginibacter sp.]
MKKQRLIIFLCITTILGCKKNDTGTNPQHPSLNLSAVAAPFTIVGGAKFYSNVSYDTDPKNVFDIFVPSSTKPTGLVIQIHGGGFKSGDKADNYNAASFQNEVNSFLADTIAYATLNYRLLLDVNEQEGVLKSLNDSKRALQFIRYYSKDFNIDKTNIVVKGGSAGAGTCLWIGLNNDMANPNATDPVLKESTRIKAIVANNSQASYDVQNWPTDVFMEYQDDGLDADSMLSIATMETFLQFYGISDTSELHTPEMISYAAKVNMLQSFSPDDPSIYVVSTNIPYTFPAVKGNLIHHPLQGKALMDKANIVGIPCKAYIPEMGIDNTSGESTYNFLVRKLREG